MYRNHWAIAASKLRDKDKKSLAVSGSAKPFEINDLLQIANHAKQDYQKKKWSIGISTHGKKPVILDDVFSKIVTWIRKFVEVGDAAVQYDPGHAALPWAAVRFLLQVSINNVEKSKLVLEGLERISNFIVWGSIQEQLQISCGVSDATTRLWSSLEKMYETMLRYLAKVIRFYNKSSSRMWDLRFIPSLLTRKF